MFKYHILLFLAMSLIGAQKIHVSKDASRINHKTGVFRDAWFSQDKFLHFSVCAAIPGYAYHVSVCRLNKDENLGRVYSISITALIGIGKEIYDKKRSGHFSWKDLVWDGMGLTVGYFVFMR